MKNLNAVSNLIDEKYVSWKERFYKLLIMVWSKICVLKRKIFQATYHGLKQNMYVS